MDTKQQIKSKKTPILATFIYLLVFFAGIFVLANIITRFYVGLFYLTIGLLMIPKIHRKIEEKLKFSFNWKIKTVVIILLMIPVFVLTPHYVAKEKLFAEQKRINQENRIKKEKEEIAEKERNVKMRMDSLSYFTSKADSLKKRKKYSAADKNYKKALTFSDTKDEAILTKHAQCLYAIGKYADAILVYNDLIYQSASKASLLYERAICYNKTKKIQEAVNDLQEAI